MDELNKRISNLSPAKRAFLDQRRHGLGKKAVLPRKTKQELAPLAFRSDGEGTPLFLFHYLTPSQVLARHLGSGRPVFGIDSAFEEELYLWEESGRIAISVEELAGRCRAVLQNAQPRGPYCLAGFCFGGVLAFEVAKQLTKRSERVAFLGLLDSLYLPGINARSVPWLAADPAEDRTSDMTEKESSRRVAFMRELVKPYKSEPYPGGAVLFRAMANRDPSDFGANGWNEVLTEGVQLEDYQTTPMGLFEEPFVVELAARLAEQLSKMDARLRTTGKLDRHALSEPEAQASAAFVEPCTPMERKVAKVWQEVLGLECVGREDNFFERGGHSLLALRMVNRLSDFAFGRVALGLVFRAPTVARFAAMLERDYVADGQPAVGACRVIPRLARPKEPNQEAVFPSSFAQRQLWLVDQMNPGTATYNIPRAFRVTGNLDVTALERSLGELVRRHEILRTTFRPGAQGDPVQVIAPFREVALSVIDLRGSTAEERATRTRERMEAEAWAPFDLGKGPLLRTALLRTADDEHLLVLTFHHIIYDEWSDRVLIRELLAAYEAFAVGRKPVLPELAIQYADYAQWQRELLSEQQREEHLGFWRDRLGDLPVLQLPIDRPRLRPEEAAGANELVEVSPRVTGALRELGRTEGATLFATVLAAFNVLLARYSGQDDLVVGSPITNRDSTEAEALIGYFLNPLVLRTKLDGDPTFREALRRVRDGTLEDFEHRELPFDSLVEALAPERGAGVNPFFQVIFVLTEGQTETHSAGGVQFEAAEVEDRTANFDLSLSVVAGPDKLRGVFNYNSGLFDRETMERMARHFATLLEGIAANPDARLSELPLLEHAEKNRVLLDWNDTCRDYPKDVRLHELIEAQVERTPDAVAVVFEDERLTYREVNRRANQLAHRLCKFGVGPEVIVGVFAERSVEMVVGLVATLKAGGAYLPLDPSYPVERLAFMLDDAQPIFVLVQRSLAAKLPQYAGEIIFLEDDFGAESDANPTNLTQSENLAYVIYTSGSTGRPKAVMNTHRGICNWLLWLQEAYPLTAEDRILQKTVFTFDVSLGEFFWSLIAGSQLVIARPGLHGDSDYLIKTICENRITAIYFVPSMLSAFLEDKNAGRCSSLRYVISLGEALPLDLQERFFAVLPHAQLPNLYGPTEAAVVVTYWKCERELGERIVPIGRPVANTQMYILDRAMQPVPIGAVGELHIGGVQVARGYLARPELTAEKFVPNPFGGGRLYKTGDLVRYRSDGTIEFMGRIDHQVKLRGFRIELGEIEAVLRKHPAVRDCVVLAREDRAAPKRLVAYALLSEELTMQALRRHAAAFLPDYMIPSALVPLEKLPLNGSGKIDRRALPEPAAIPTEKASVGPRDGLETELAAIWEKVLENAPIGVADDFFELGGNSLRAVRVMAEIKKAFGRNLPLSILFQTPTVETLAQALRTGTRPMGWSPLVPIQLRGDRPPFFAIHGVHGNVLFYRQLAQLLGKEQPFCGIQSQGLDGEPITRTSIEAMADYYIEQIQKVQPHGPYLLGGYSLGGSIAYEMARRLSLAGEAVPLVALIDAGNPARPARLVSYRARLRKVLGDPASLFMVDRFARILAGRIRGKAGAQFLNWNDLYQKTKWRLAKKLGRNEAYDLTDLHIQMVHARAVLAFRPLPLNGKITLIRALELEPGYDYDPYLGWDSLATDGIEVHEVPGAHLELFSDENVSVLAKILDGCIQSALATPNNA